nr:CobD/CbiB family cobalamin biosynthesis protein [Desulforamulus aquiferis]
MLVFTVCLLTFSVTWGLIWLAFKLHYYLGIALHLWLLSTTFAVKGLAQHALAVAKPLNEGNLSQAREKLSLIVGRDTQNLNEQEIVRGTVETVAENTVDGIIAPIFYAVIGGAPWP